MNSSVCKFSINRSSDLICECFIYEANAMQAEVRRARTNYVFLVSEGYGELKRGFEEEKIKSGDLFFVTEGTEFSIKNQGGLKYYYICFRGRRANELTERFMINDANCIFEGYGRLIPFWKECQERAVKEIIDLVCESALLLTFSYLQPSPKQPNNVIASVVAITQEEFTSHNLSISGIAERLGYDAKYLSSLFKKKRGVSYTRYLRDLRIKRAIFLMEQGLVSVKNIAALSGFGDALYFSRVFSANEGVSPSDYIAKIEAEESLNKKI